MAVINILMTGEDAGDWDGFDNGDTRYVFDRLTSSGPQRLIEGPVCAFIDWVLEDLSGLEMCRRLRADPRTFQKYDNVAALLRPGRGWHIRVP